MENLSNLAINVFALILFTTPVVPVCLSHPKYHVLIVLQWNSWQKYQPRCLLLQDIKKNYVQITLVPGYQLLGNYYIIISILTPTHTFSTDAHMPTYKNIYIDYCGSCLSIENTHTPLSTHTHVPPQGVCPLQTSKSILNYQSS